MGADGPEWLARVVRALKHGRRRRDQWSTGVSRKIKFGYRVFLLRQGKDQPGIVGSGYVTKGWFPGEHWDEKKRKKKIKANYIRVEWDSMVLLPHVLRRARLLRGVLPETLVNAQASGCSVEPANAARLESSWTDHLNSISSGVARLRRTNATGGKAKDDSIDDLYGDDCGSDDPPRYKVVSSGIRRDPRVRRKVIKRSKRICERSSCGTRRSYPGFIEVHHILGAAKSDRVWNCVALCPNCHREAHYAPNRNKLNKELLRYAAQFK